MKAYKVELLVLDFENIGVCEETFELDYDHLSTQVMSIQSKDIGEWDDDHPLNHRDKSKEFYNELFQDT